MKGWVLASCLALKLLGLWIVFVPGALAPGLAVFFSGGAVVLWQIFLPRSQGLCDTYSRFRPEGKEVWLTIDDGPCPEDTPAILDLLSQYEAKATFFLIGERAARYPELVDAILEAGHSIGSHTQTHPSATFWAAGPARVSRELDQSLTALKRSGHVVDLFRAPVGIKSLFLAPALRRRGLLALAWSVRSRDTRTDDPAAIQDLVRRKLDPGAILLMHEGPKLASGVRVEAIRRILSLLDATDYRAVIPEKGRIRK